jgi:hypothetical protein
VCTVARGSSRSDVHGLPSKRCVVCCKVSTCAKDG